MKRFFVGLLLFLCVIPTVVPHAALAQTTEAAFGDYRNDSTVKGKTNCQGPWDSVQPTCMLLTITSWLLKLSAFFLYCMALLFEVSIDYSLNIRDLLKQLPIVDISWAMFRDLANLTFIFILLYAAINIVLGTNGYNIKSILTKVILVAVFINFSLFFTKITIDLANITALQFYGKLITNNQTRDDGSSGITDGLMTGLGLTKFFKDSNTEIQYKGENGKKNDSLYTNDYWESNVWKVILVALMGTVFITITGFVLGAAAVMFVIRSAILIFLMLLSPLAFAAIALPGMSKYFDQWKEKLFSQSFFAPIYMVLFYAVVTSLTNWGAGNGGKGLDFNNIVLASSGMIEIIFSFTILTILMLGCLLIAEKGGASGANVASKWGKNIAMKPLNWAGAGAKGTAKYLGTSARAAALGLGSAGANMAAQSGWMQSLASSKKFGGLGRAALRATNDAGKIYRDKVDKKKKDIEAVGKLISEKDPGLTQGPNEDYGAYEKRKGEAQKAAANLAMGLTADGSASSGLIGFTPAGRNARRAIIKQKTAEAQKKAHQKAKESETGKKAIIEKRLKKMLYGEGDMPAGLEVKNFAYSKGGHHESSSVGKIEKEIENLEAQVHNATDETERGIAMERLGRAETKLSETLALFEELQSQHEMEEEKLAGKFDDLQKALKDK